MKSRIFSLILVFLCQSYLQAASSYLEEGKKLFLDNKPQEARPLLEEALNLDPTNEKIYLDLAMTYEQLNEHEKSFNLLKKGVNYASNLKYLFYYNMGNNLSSMGQNTLAEEMYTKAIIDNATSQESYLNRANARLNQSKYSSALVDYKKYLQIKPDTPQRPGIEAIIKLLTEALADEERQKLEKEERDRNLQNLLNSLQNAADNTKNLSAGTEKLQPNYEPEDILD